MPERPVVDGLALVPHQDDRARQEAVIDRLLDDGVNPTQAAQIDAALNLTRSRVRRGQERITGKYRGEIVARWPRGWST